MSPPAKKTPAKATAKPPAKRTPRQRTPPTLADQLAASIDGLNALIPEAASAAERQELRARRKDAFRQWETALRLQAAERTADFAAATKAIQAANREIAAAKKDIARIAKTVDHLATAAKLVDRAIALALKAL